MRVSALLVVFGIAACALASASPAVPPAGTPKSPLLIRPWPDKYLSLDSEDALADLQHSNPRHYAIARKILAAASEICSATKSQVIPAKFDAQDISCARNFWLTSYPPKRQLQFTIEDTYYSALVTVRDLHAKFVRDLRAEATPTH